MKTSTGLRQGGGLEGSVKRSILGVLLVAAFLMSGFFAPQSASAVAGGANVTPASGGTNISIDTTSAGPTPAFKTLSGPTITETAPGDIVVGDHTITLPPGWEFDISSTVTVLRIVGDIEPDSQVVTPGINSLTFTITSPSTENSGLAFVISSMKVRPTGMIPSTGSMTYSGAGIAGVSESTNFGTLSTVPGTVAQLAFTTQPGNTTVYGSDLSTQPVVVTKDQFGNNSTAGLGASNMVELSLISGSGMLMGATSIDIGTGVGNGTATFTDLSVDAVGTKQLRATATGVTSADSDTFEITQKPLTATVTVENRPYNGDVDAVITDVVLNEKEDGDDVTVSNDGMATFASSDADTDIVVTSDGVTITGDDIGNYSFDNMATGTADITPLAVTGSFTTENKVYNGNTTASVLSQSLSGVLAGDVGNVALTGGAANFADANVGTGITVTASGMSLSGSAFGNYSLTSVDTEVADITPAPLTVTADAKSKVYGTVDPTLTYTHGALAGSDTEAVFAGSLARAVGENVGTYAISQGTLFAGLNYTVSFTGANLTITPKPLTVSFTTHANKTYDGDNSADITGRSLDGVIDPEIVSVTGGSATFADKHVGPAKIVTATGFALTGADKDNYVIGTINTTTGNVNPRPITITAQTDTKIYDATADSNVTPVTTSSFSPAVVAVDSELFTQTYDNKNVGGGKTLTPSGTVTDGNSGNNYTITLTPVSTGEITTAPLTATVIVEKKVIDGNNSATITSVTLSGILLSDVVTVNSQGTATFANATVGTHAVSATGVTIIGGDAGNYSFDGTATGTGDILPIPTVVYVDDNWAEAVAWTDPDGTGSATYFGYDAFATIQEGIDAVASSGTVNVAAGTYAESVTISKSLTLQKQEGAVIKPILQVNDSWGFKLLGATDITIDGFEIQIIGGGSANDQAIRLENADGAVIKNNTITTTADTALGIWICGTDSGCESSDNVSINDNNITIGGVATGIYAEQVDIAHTGWSITGNAIVANAGVLLELYDVTDSTVDDNILDGSTTNSNTIWSSQRADIFDLVFTNNIISDSSGSMVAFLSDFLLLGDSLDDTTVSGVNINGNTFNGWGSRGLRIGDGVTVVTVNENKFLGTGETLKNEDAASVNAEENWWGTAVVATIEGKTNGAIDFEPYYVESGMSILSNDAVNTTYVDSTYSDGAGNGGHYFGYDAFATIQEGIDAVASSGTVNVATGVYDEQLQINKDITVSGATGATVQPTGNDDAWDIQFTTGGSGATLKGFTFDFNGATNNRAGRGIAVSDLNGSTVTNVTIQNNDITMGVGIGAATEGLEGVGIQTGINADVSGLFITNNQFHGGSTAILDGLTAGEEGVYINPNSGTGSITISNNTFDGQLFTGISIESDNVTASGNMVTRSAAVQNTNGIRVNDFVGGKSYDVTLTNNVVSGFDNGFRFGSVSDGGSTLAISLTDNTISNNTRGVWVRHDATVTTSGNSITGNTTGAEILDGSDGSLSAEANWWGDVSGPSHTSNAGAIGDAVSDNVDYRPWCVEETCTTVDTTAPTPAISSSAGLLTNDSPIPFSVNFGENVTGFELADITVGNGSPTPDSLVFTGTNYTFNITPTGEGVVTVSIAAEKVWDASGNYNTGSNTSSVEYDSEAPTLSSVSISSGNADENLAKVGDTVSVTFTASEEIQTPNVTIADHSGLELIGLENIGNDWTATYVMQEGDTEGPVVFSITPTDMAGNVGTAVTAVSESGGSVSFDKTAPIISIDSPDADSKVSGTAVIEFATDDEGGTVTCSVNGGALVTCVSEETTLANVTGFNGLGQVEFMLTVNHTDAAGNIGEDEVTLTKDTFVPTVDSHTPSINAVNVETSTITIVFNEAVNVSDGQITISPATAFTIDGSDTDTITLNTGSLESNTVYTVTVTTNVKDLAGNAIAEAYDWSFTTATLYNVALNADDGGWNLVSLPVVPTNKDIGVVLGDSEANIEEVWAYDPTDPNAVGGWLVYVPGNPEGTNNLDIMTAGYGYWVSVTADETISGSGSLLVAGPTTPPSRDLSSGWNLIGYYQIPGESESTPGAAFTSLGGSYTGLWGFDNSDGSFKSSVSEILPGDAFWISLPSAKSYTPSNIGDEN